MRSVRGALLGALLWTALTACSGQQDATLNFSPPEHTTPIVGVQYHGVWDDHDPATRRRILDDLAAAGVRYVRMDVAWGALQPEPGTFDLAGGVADVDARMAEIAARDMKVLLLFHWAPRWASGTSAKNGVPRDATEFGVAAAWAARRWQDTLTGIELLNEPDKQEFLADTSPATYTELVTTAYPLIKQAAPDVTVVAGAPTYVNTSWYAQFFALGGAHHFDALGIHPYMGLSDAPPDSCDTGNIEHYPCNIPKLVELMQANGDGDRSIWVTEYGWSSHPNPSPLSDVPNWDRGVTQQQQADYLIQMQDVLTQWPQVQASFWYTSWDRATGDPQMDNWGLLARDLSRKPAYYAMRCVASGVCSEPG